MRLVLSEVRAANPSYELFDRNLQSIGEQILRMQQVGEGTDFPLRLIDRRIDIIADFPRTRLSLMRAERALRSSWRQSNAGKSNHADRTQSAAAPLPEATTAEGRIQLQPAFRPSCRLLSRRPLFDGPVAADQPDDTAAFGIPDGIDRCIELASASAESKAAAGGEPAFLRPCMHRRPRKSTSRLPRSCSHELLFSRSASIEIPSKRSKAGFMLS